MVDIIFLRHAQTLANIGIFSSNSPLSAKGIQQANTLNGTFDLVIISELYRTWQTLTNSFICYQYIIQTPLCNELSYDKQKNEKNIDLFKKFLKNLVNTNKYKKILVITHSKFIQSFLGINTKPNNCQNYLISI